MWLAGLVWLLLFARPLTPLQQWDKAAHHGECAVRSVECLIGVTRDHHRCGSSDVLAMSARIQYLTNGKTTRRRDAETARVGIDVAVNLHCHRVEYPNDPMPLTLVALAFDRAL